MVIPNWINWFFLFDFLAGISLFLGLWVWSFYCPEKHRELLRKISLVMLICLIIPLCLIYLGITMLTLAISQ